MKLTNRMKFNAMSIIALSVIVAGLSTSTYKGNNGLLSLHKLSFVYLALAIAAGLIAIKKVNFSVWDKAVAEKMKVKVVATALAIGNFFAAYSETGWQYAQDHNVSRAYCIAPMCIEGRGIGMYLLIGATLFLLYQYKQLAKR